MKKICDLPSCIISVNYDWSKILPDFHVDIEFKVFSSIFHRYKFRTVMDLECDLFDLHYPKTYSFTIHCYLYKVSFNSPVRFTFVKDLGKFNYLVKANKDNSFTLYSK